MRLEKGFLPWLFFIGLTGCGIVAKVHARDDMMAAKEAYTGCLRQHNGEIGVCQGLREAYLVDLQAYRETAAGLNPGYNLNQRIGVDPQ